MTLWRSAATDAKQTAGTTCFAQQQQFELDGISEMRQRGIGPFERTDV
jgi:hypothetical protein